MEVRFEISDRDYEELGPWPLAVGDTARAQLYAFRDHSPAQVSGGRLLLPDLALAPGNAPRGVWQTAPTLTTFCGRISSLRTRRGSPPERRDETTIRLECGVPLCLVLYARRWDAVDIAPAVPPPGAEAWRAARPIYDGDVLSGTLELQEAAFETGGVSSFALLDARAPDYPVRGVVLRIEQLDLNAASATFGSALAVERLPDGLFWPHRYFVTLEV